MVGDTNSRTAAQSLAYMAARPDEASHDYENLGDFAHGDPSEDPCEDPRARSRCCGPRCHWRTLVAAILAACGAVFASFLDGWTLCALRALESQSTTSGSSGFIDGPFNSLEFGHEFNSSAFNNSALNGSAFNSSEMHKSGYNGTAFTHFVGNDFHFIGRTFDDVAFNRFTHNSSDFTSPIFDSSTFDHLAFNRSSNNNDSVPVKDSAFNANSDPAFNIPAHAFVDRALNDTPLNDRAQNDSALNGTDLNHRADYDFALNDRTDGSSASNDGNSSTLNVSTLIERGDNGSALNAPTLRNRGDNGSALNDRDGNGTVLNGPTFYNQSDNRFSYYLDGTIGTSGSYATQPGALDGFWSFHPTLLHAMMPLGTALAAWVFGRGADRVGRRLALLASGLFGTFAWLLLLLCDRFSVYWVCASRFLVGVQMGAIFTVFPVYVAEIAHPRSRGLAGTMVCVAVALGRLLWAVFGRQEWLWWAGLVPLPALVLQLLLRNYMPETPDFLAQVGRLRDAMDVSRLLHGAHFESTSELWRLERLVPREAEAQEDDANETNDTNDTSDTNHTNDVNSARGPAGASASGRAAPRAIVCPELLRLRRRLLAAALRRQQQRRRTAIANTTGLFVLAPLAATDVLRFYADEFISKIGESDINIAAVIGILELAALLLSAGFVDYIGRRALFFISTLGLAIIHSGLSVVAGYDENSLNWLIFLLSGLFFAHDIGLGSVPWVVLSDMLPASGRAHLSGVIVLLHRSVISGLIFLFPFFHSYVGDKWTFIILVLTSLTNNIYVGHMIKETKNRTLEQIQKELEKVESSSDSSDSDKDWP